MADNSGPTGELRHLLEERFGPLCKTVLVRLEHMTLDELGDLLVDIRRNQSLVDHGLQSAQAVVIGYGSDIRGDDAAGIHAANTIAVMGLPGVRVLTAHQLTPELAEVLATVRLAVFVDAYAASETADVQVRPVKPETSSLGLEHTSNPTALLATTQAIYDRCPSAWLVCVPAVNFDFGFSLSPVAEQGVTAAVEEIKQLLADHLG